MIRPKKALGQHFLKDHNIAVKIVDSLEFIHDSTVIEIGPGKGILTQYLLKKPQINLLAVELDKEAYKYLLEAYPEIEGKLLLNNFLHLDLATFGDKITIIGNFPYNISSQILFRILEYYDSVEEIVCMLQKEVADRIISGPGNKSYGILSVFLQTWYDISYLFTVNSDAFYPKPKIRSAVIRLVRNKRKDLGCDEKLYKTLVKTSFNQRRKMLRNSLSELISGLDIEETLLRKRPEQLSVEDFIELANNITRQK